MLFENPELPEYSAEMQGAQGAGAEGKEGPASFLLRRKRPAGRDFRLKARLKFGAAWKFALDLCFDYG